VTPRERLRVKRFNEAVKSGISLCANSGLAIATASIVSILSARPDSWAWFWLFMGAVLMVLSLVLPQFIELED
jgi:hypothetical protein